MAEAVTNDEKFIVLEAPVTLKEDQNFYDQPPFSTVLSKVSDKFTKVTVDELRYILTRSVSTSTNFYGPNFTERVNKDLETTGGVDLIRSKNKEAHFLNILRLAIHEMGIDLSIYPYWADYVLSQHRSGWYKPDGSWFNPRSKTPYIPTRSYAKWVSEKLAGQRAYFRLGLEEIFPQDFAIESPITTPIEHTTSSHKRWQILKASELVREKR